LDVQIDAAEASVTFKVEVVHVTLEDAALTVGGAGFGARFLLNAPEERQAVEAPGAPGRLEGLGTPPPAPPPRPARRPLRRPGGGARGWARCARRRPGARRAIQCGGRWRCRRRSAAPTSPRSTSR